MLKDKIREERTKKHMSLSEVARQSGHAVSTLHGIENGYNKSPSFKTICDVANVIGIPLDELAKEECNISGSPNERINPLELEFENSQLRLALEQFDSEFFTRKCRVCGCDWNHACPGGCYWVEKDLCSRCANKLRTENQNGC